MLGNVDVDVICQITAALLFLRFMTGDDCSPDTFRWRSQLCQDWGEPGEAGSVTYSLGADISLPQCRTGRRGR